MAKHKGPEGRKDPRIKKKIGVNIVGCNNKSTLPKLDEEVGLNISLGGVLVECSKRLTRGCPLKLKIMLTFDSKFKIIQTPAKIIWNKKSFRNTYYLGCKFTRLKPTDKRALIRYTKNNLPK